MKNSRSSSPTDKPAAPLLGFVCDRLIITSKAAFDKYGRDSADKEHLMGGGPYRLKELIPGQRLVIAKRPDHPEAKKNPQGPGEIVYRVMRETEQRVTALLNDEIQIAQFIPPHLRQRVEKSSNLRITAVDSVEIMFLAMQPKPPFDKKEVRQAVCHAINRDQIISTVLEGFASRLDGPIGPGQYGYDPQSQTKTNDPETSKKLLTQAGYPNGVDVELQTPVGRYTLDKQLTEAMIPMLNAGGFRAKLLTPEWPTLWANVQKGTMPSIIWAEAQSKIRARRCTSTFTPERHRGSVIPTQSWTSCWTKSKRSSIRRSDDNFCHRR